MLLMWSEVVLTDKAIAAAFQSLNALIIHIMIDMELVENAMMSAYQNYQTLMQYS